MFSFEYNDVPTSTEVALRERIESGVGAVVTGQPGSGKTYAVAKAVNGAVWSTVSASPLAVPRILADLAEGAQAESAAEVLRVYAAGSCREACELLDDLLGARVVVVDAVERLRGPARPDGFEEINTALLWGAEREELATWLFERVERSATVVVTRASFAAAWCIRHTRLPSWSVKLSWSGEGFLDWKPLVDRLENNPGALALAATALRLGGRKQMVSWLEQTTDIGFAMAVRELIQLIRDQMPPELAYALTVLHHAGETSRPMLEALAERDERLELGIELARVLRLIEEHADRIRVLPFFDTHPARQPQEVGATEALDALCRELLADVNDLSTLDPRLARRVLDAHRIQLALGRFDDAVATARLHLAGLVDLARQQGIAACSPSAYAQARASYAAVRQLIRDHEGLAAPQVRSYVAHYHGFNGHRGRCAGLEAIAADYDEAITLWPENALWHARRIALAAEGNDLATARAQLRRAYHEVAEHPRRDGFLRVRAAQWADAGGARLFALELLDSVEASSLPPDDVAAAKRYERLVRRWGTGLEVHEIPLLDGRLLVFSRVPRVHIVQGAEGAWSAELQYPPAKAEAKGPWSALCSLGVQIADECQRLVSCPTGRLDPKDVRRKGALLGLVDLAASVVGLRRIESRWLLGSVAPGEFRPQHEAFDPVPVPSDLQPDTTVGLFFARVATNGSGWPVGEVERLVPAGSGRRVDELIAALHELSRRELSA